MPKAPLILASGALFATLARAEVTIKAATAADAQDGNPPVGAFDADPGTRWSSHGHGRWVQAELSAPLRIDSVRIGFHHGERDYGFEIFTSPDGGRWQSGTGGRLQSRGEAGTVAYAIGPVEARFVRVTVYGSEASPWANIHTIALPGVPPLESSAGEARAWVADPALKNGVALSLDDRGNAYVAVSERRKQSSLDIRHHQDLVERDLSLTTVEERRAWYREDFTGAGWLPDRDGDGTRDWRDLTVQRDRVVRVRPHGSVEEVDAFHSEVTGIAAGVLAVGADLFVAAEPDFYRYTDSDGDGLPDRGGRQLVATGFQVHMGQGGHNMSGVALGSDGRVYWSLGDKGHCVETAEGALYHMPNAGAVFRCELDGSGVERFSTGERNAQELAFDAFGNLFSMDNDGDYPGEMERALYITEGSEHGWRLNWQWLGKGEFGKISGLPAYNPWMDEKLFLPDREGHAAYLTPTIGNFGPGPCGFAANPGTALSPGLGTSFFMTNQKGEVRVFEFEPEGASFRFGERPKLSGGVNNTGLAFGPDGALYAASYGAGDGAVYRFDVPEAERHPLRAETAAILATPSAEAAPEALVAWLDHADRRVRMKGQLELARRGADGGVQHLQRALVEAETPVGRLHSVWGIGQLARRDPDLLPLLAPAWESGEPELVAQAAKVTGEVEGGAADLPALRAGLAHASPRVRFFCAIALGNRGDRASAPALVELLATGGAEDAYLRHAAVMGLKGAMTPGELAGLASHESRTVRLGAVVALRKLAAPEVRAFLADADELVVLEAARAIHDDASIPAALPDLAAVLKRDDLSGEAALRRAINAALRVGAERDLDLLVGFLRRGTASATLQRCALASILWWSAPPVLDAVEGRYRKHAPRDGAGADAAVAALSDVIFASEELTEVLLDGVALRGEPAWLAGAGERFAAWPPGLQRRYLAASAKVASPELARFVQLALGSEDAAVREEARRHADAAGLAAVDLLLAELDAPGPWGKGAAVLGLADLDDPAAGEALGELFERYRAGGIDPRWKLEVWRAAAAKGVDLPATPDRLERGGDPGRGRGIVFTHAAAQCLRCHQIGERGGGGPAAGIGPDLSGIGAKLGRRELVEALADPSASVADGYGTVLLELAGGERVAGTLKARTDSAWTVVLPDAGERVVEAGAVAAHSVLSLMPPMGAILQPEEIRDVVSYLATLR